MVTIHWNHRVFKQHIDEHYSEYTIREVYYSDETGKILGWTAEPVAPYGLTPDELSQDLDLFKEALEKPVLEIDPEDENKLIGVELGSLDYGSDELVSISAEEINQLLVELEREDEQGL